MPDSEEDREEAVRALTAEVVERFRRGESRASVRAGLVAAGLSADLTDGLLAGVGSPVRWPVGSVAGIVLSVIVMAVFPVTGLAFGCWLAWDNWPTPPEHACGLWVFIPLFISTCLAVIGLSVGVVLAYVAVWGLSVFFAHWGGGEADDLGPR
jgi:hypothetical protein